NSIGHTLHPEHADFLLHQLGKCQFFKAAVMSVHNVERHLYRIEFEPVLLGYLEHIEVDARVLVTGKADVAELSRFARLAESGIGAVFVEDAMRILIAEDLVVLDQIDAVGLQATQRLFQLPRSFLFRAAVDFGHQEYFAPVAVAQRFAHADLTRAIVVVPAVVHKVDAAIDRSANDPDAQLFIHGFETEMPASKTNGRYPFFGAAQGAVRHFSVWYFFRHDLLPF